MGKRGGLSSAGDKSRGRPHQEGLAGSGIRSRPPQGPDKQLISLDMIFIAKPCSGQDNSAYDHYPSETTSMFFRTFRMSLQLRILLLMILTAIGILGASEFITSLRTVQALENEIGGETSQVARMIARNLESSLALGAVQELKGAFQKARKVYPGILRVDVFVKRKNKVVQVMSNSNDPRAPEDLEEAVFRRHTPITFMIEQEDGKRHMITARLIHLEDHTPAVLSVASSLKSFKQLIDVQSRIRKIAMMVTIVLLVGAVMLLFQTNIYHSMQHLLQVMARYRHGDQEARVNERLPGEFGELGEQMNIMLDQITKLQQNLTHQVAEATAFLASQNEELKALNLQLVTTQKKLVQSERLALIGQLTATFAHEIGSPLGAVSTNLQLVQEQEGLPGHVAKRIKTAYQQIERVCTIVEQLLSRTRRPALFQPIHGVRLIEELRTLLGPVLDARRIVLSIEDRTQQAWIQGDQDQLQQLFLNVLNNAMDALPTEGRIHLLLTNHNHQLVFAVTDNGSGIEPDKLNRIFEPFFTTKEFKKGNGLGLAVGKDIVAAHQGTIEVTSQVQQGTTVTISLPLKKDDL